MFMTAEDFYILKVKDDLKQITNAFYHRPKEWDEWKKSKKPLRIVNDAGVVCDMPSLDELMKNSWIATTIKEYLSQRWGWLPIWKIYQSFSTFRLYWSGPNQNYSNTKQGWIKTQDQVDQNEKPKLPSFAWTKDDLDYQQNLLKVKTGDIGEIAIQRHFKAMRSDDWYDSEKDGVLPSGQTYEVKTFRLNFSTLGFWVDESQWQKLDDVDVLFFVRVPEKEDELARAYVCLDKNTCYTREQTNSGQKVRNYPLTNCLEQFSLYEEESKTIFENSKKLAKHNRF